MGEAYAPWEAYQNLKAEFEELRGIKVVIEATDHTTVVDKTTADLTGKAAIYDAFALDYYEIGKYAENGWVLETEELLRIPDIRDSNFDSRRNIHPNLRVSGRGSIRKIFRQKIRRKGKFMGGKLENRIAIVTGGASGLGKAVSHLFAKNDATVVVIGRNIDKAQKVVKDIENNGGRAIALQCDVTQESEVIKSFDFVVEKYGRIDILHANAGILGRQKRITETSLDEWEKVISINLTGVWLCAKYAIIQMLKQGGGNIVFTSSNWAFVCDPGYAPYAASKGGVVSFARALALDHAKDNIRINVICPGNMATPMLDKVLSLQEDPDRFLEEMGRVSKPEEIAPLVLFLASDESSAMKGSAVIIDQGETLQYGPGVGT